VSEKAMQVGKISAPCLMGAMTRGTERGLACYHGKKDTKCRDVDVHVEVEGLQIRCRFIDESGGMP
jgi:hypothetical protein